MYPPQAPPPGYPPSGYPPYPPVGAPYPYMQPPPMYRPTAPGRSAVPRVVGILAIIFCCIGIGFAVLETVGQMADIDRWGVKDELHGEIVWIYVALGLSCAIFLLHLIGGIQAVRYAKSAPLLITIYAIAALALAIGDAIVPYVVYPSSIGNTVEYFPRHAVHESLVEARLGLAICAAVWPIVALVLINLRAAREACGGGSAANARPQDVF